MDTPAGGELKLDYGWLRSTGREGHDAASEDAAQGKGASTSDPIEEARCRHVASRFGRNASRPGRGVAVRQVAVGPEPAAWSRCRAVVVAQRLGVGDVHRVHGV